MLDQNTFDEICARIATGETLSDICRDLTMPHRAVVYRACAENPEWKKQFREAREIGLDAIADDILAIADGKVLTKTTKKVVDGVEVTESETLDRKMQVHARLQLLAKWGPEKYGNALKLETTDKTLQDKTIEELKQELAELTQKP